MVSAHAGLRTSAREPAPMGEDHWRAEPAGRWCETQRGETRSRRVGQAGPNCPVPAEFPEVVGGLPGGVWPCQPQLDLDLTRIS